MCQAKDKHQIANKARITYTLQHYGKDKALVLHRGIVRFLGHEWKFGAKTRKECEEKVRTKLIELEREGVSAVALSADEKRDAAKARKLLETEETLESALKERQLVHDVLGTGKALADTLEELQKVRSLLGGRCSLLDAASFWEKHHPEENAVTLDKVCSEYLEPENRKKGGNSPSHVRGLRQKFQKLLDVFGASSPIATIMPNDLEGFLQTLAKEENWAPLTFNHWLTVLRGLFSYADRKYHVGNATAGIESKKVFGQPPRYFTPEEAEKLLRTAEAVAPDYAAAVAILLFAGLRPTELVGQYGLAGGGGIIGGLAWNKVDVDGEIVVDFTKTNQRRTVPISPNLDAWLKRYGKVRGPVVPNPTAWRRARRKIEAASGVLWTADMARHSFATYHYALHRNRDELEAAMGHVEGGSTVLERHYKGLEKKSEAERYWTIMPSLGEVTADGKSANQPEQKGSVQ